MLVGAPTENPYFEVNSALISRSRVVELQPLDDDSIRELLRRALADERGLAGAFELEPEAEDEIVTLAGGDGRAALTSLELASQMVDEKDDGLAGEGHARARPRGQPPPRPGLRQVRRHALRHHLGVPSSPCAAATPTPRSTGSPACSDAGEDPKFIARRIMICASEDIGNADPQALLVAHAAFRATEVIGMPECRINLAQAATYLL